MKSIVTVLMDSPFYFTMSLQERHRLVKRLQTRAPEIDLSLYRQKLEQLLYQSSSFVY
jgi:hypothetical protein